MKLWKSLSAAGSASLLHRARWVGRALHATASCSCCSHAFASRGHSGFGVVPRRRLAIESQTFAPVSLPEARRIAGGPPYFSSLARPGRRASPVFPSLGTHPAHSVRGGIH